MELTHVNGDFYRLSPRQEFVPLQPRDERVVPFDARVPVINESSAPSGFYFVFSRDGEELPPQVVADVQIEPFERPEQTRRGEADRLEMPTSQSRFRENEKLVLLPVQQVAKIIPTPVTVKDGDGKIELNPSWRIHYSKGLASEAEYLAVALESALGSKLPIAEAGDTDSNLIRLSVDALGVAGKGRRSGAEAYLLTIDRQRGIQITGSDRAGIFYGIQSLRALVPPEALRGIEPGVQLPEIIVEDAPQFHYRGLHLDVARNFQSKETVKKLLDLMAFYKLNRLHLHLTDDEGWRLAVEKLPELTEVGGRRGHTRDEKEWLVPSFGSGPDPAVSPGSGHCTRKDFVQILQYANERHIQVTPEIDVPGHARAAIKAMEARYRRLLTEGKEKEAREYLLSDLEDRSEYRSVQGWTDNVINTCQESTYRFLETVVDEIVEVWREAGAPLEAIHIGGDVGNTKSN